MGSVHVRAGVARAAEGSLPQSVWLNPEPQSRWRGSTIDEVARVIDMFPLTVDGLTEAMTLLNKGAISRR